ncbi:hypothetical protein OIE66_40180 [Nonomuraea sp. NBC_01738]|uniref:hypothetical protein n=1 Tax=Nonomuraea sp. NBC_01738 TaxID=2976003 RepID=UPI002E1598EC|nr:hypothetical protein OIE66_40180 [Nonomuraea sp. NBC_01738]
MPKSQDLFAAAIAPVIDAAHVNIHAHSRAAGALVAEELGISPGLLVDLRYALRHRPMSRHDLETVYRYGTAADLDDELAGHLAQGTLEPGYRTTALGNAFIDGLYAVHAATADRVWPEVTVTSELVGRVLAAAMTEAGPALSVMAPPYEPERAGAGLLLFNRLAALRYHRADAHAAAWRAAGLTARQVVTLRGGQVRESIEADTNARAALPYAVLTDDERDTLITSLGELV